LKGGTVLAPFVSLEDKNITALISENLFPRWRQENERLDIIDNWMRWKHENIRLPRSATTEHKVLAGLSRVPWLSLVVSSVAQCLYVDGFRSSIETAHDNPDAPDPAVARQSPPWETWNANAMDRQQIAIHRAALGYGYCYESILPGLDAWGESTHAAMRGVSPRKAFAAYVDPAEDEWPEYVLRCDSRGEGKGWTLRLYDFEKVWTYTLDSESDKPQFVSLDVHEVGVTPFVRFANMMDLDGRCDGEVEPLIPLAGRINKTSYDRLLTQHFSSWKIRTAVGLSEPDSQEEANRKKLQLRQDDILVAEGNDVKFGTLDETDIGPFVAAWRSDIEALAAVSQTPTHALTGQLVNLSAEALAAARAGMTQKVSERQRSFGASHVQALRLAAQIEGYMEYADDMMARVTWQDMEIRSMSQAVDALGKAATMLHVPLPALWQRIPGVEKTDVDEWEKTLRENGPLEQLIAEMNQQGAGPKAQPATTKAPAKEPVE
jgi:hypothetical protein